MQKNRNNWTIKKIIFLFAILCLVAKLIFDFFGFWVNLGFIFEYIGYMLSYLLIGFIIAYVLNAYIDFWDKKILKKVMNNNKKTKKAICIIIAYLTFFGIISFLIFTLVPTLTNTFNDLKGIVPSLIDNGIDFYSDILDGTKYEIPEDVLKSIENGIDALINSLISLFDIKLLTVFLSNTTTWLFNFIMGIMVSVYMLIEKDNSINAFNRIIDGLLPKKSGDRIRWIGREINRIFRQYFTGKLLQSLICTTLIYIAFTIARVPYAPLFAVIFGITNMIPYIGPWIGAVPVTLVSLVSDFWLGVSAVICILIIQAIDNWFISPKIVGGKMGISPLLVLAGLSIGGKLFGLPGLVFGDVFAAIFKLFFYDVFIANRIEEKNKKQYINKEDMKEEIEEEELDVSIETPENKEDEDKIENTETVKISVKQKIRNIFKK